MGTETDLISTDRFIFRRSGMTVKMESRRGRPSLFAPSTVVAVADEDRMRLYVSRPTSDGSGPAPCVESDWNEFAEVLVNKSMTSPPSRWPFFFNYGRRLNDWEARYSNPVFFDLRGSSLKQWNALVRALTDLCSGHRLVYDYTVRQVYGYESRKGHGGGENVLQIWDATLVVGCHDRCHTNLGIPGLVFGDYQLWFFPNFLLIRETSGSYRLLTYSGLKVEVKETTLITSEYWPGAEIIGRTWQFVNKDGGPDRRYSHNPVLNILRMWELDIISDSGRIDLQTSNQRGAGAVATAIRAYA